MRITSSVVLILVAVLALPARPVSGGQDKPADVAGTWNIMVDIGGNTATPSVTFKQDGETLTGTYASQMLGEQKVTGTIKGNAITFEFTASFDGNAVKVTYSGTVEKATMKGKVTFGDLGEGAFSAKKQ
jgi:hypothetical protein